MRLHPRHSWSLAPREAIALQEQLRSEVISDRPIDLEAIRLVARHEGILLDPVYTAKAMACLIDHVRTRQVDPSDSVVFLHTGGVPALFAHAKLF